MYHGKHEKRCKGLGKYKKSHVLLVSFLLILLVGVGATAAYLMDSTDSVVNAFDPAHVTCEIQETLDETTKKNVQVKNTSDIPAYIRATVIVTWQDADGNVYGRVPVAGSDYTIDWGDDWTESGDYYYWDTAVPVGSMTGNLIDSCVPVEGKAPAGYSLCVEILAEAIQADGMGAASAQDAWTKAKG